MALHSQFENQHQARSSSCNQTMGYHHIQNHQRFHAMPPCLCEKCPENAATPRTLQARVAFLETQLEAARAEKSSAEKTVNYVLRLNAENTTRFSSGISEKTKSRLLRKIARANVEKEYFKDLLQQAIEAVVRLSAKGAINVKDRSLSGKTSEESANALIDFLGLDDCSVTKSPGGGLSTVNEIIQDNNFRKNHPEIEDVQMLGAQISATLSAQESTENSANNQEDLLDFNDLSPTKASDDRFSLINENSGCLQDTYGVENTEVLNDQLPTENSSDTEDDNLSNSSYIFHFSHPHMDRNSSSTDDEVFMIKSNKAPRAIKSPSPYGIFDRVSGSFDAIKSPGSDGSLTAVNSTTTELDIVKAVPERPLLPASEATAKSYSFFSTPNTLVHSSTQAITQYTASKTEMNIEILEPKKIKLEFSKREMEDMSPRHKIWESPQERNYPGFFKYGLHYTPTPGSWNSFRSLVISGLPFKVTMTMVLDKVRGGVVIDAKLLDTTTITGSKTALITFLHERVATAFETYTKKHPLKFYDQTVDVAPIQTPTWPDSPCDQNAVFDGRRTRCLSISHLPEDISPSILLKDLRVCSVMTTTRVESMAKRNGVVELRFSSVRYASQAYGILTSICRYRPCVVRFTPDPCDQPIESISHETKHNASIFLKDIEDVNDDDGKHKPDENEDHYGRLSTVKFEVSADVARGRNTCSDM